MAKFKARARALDLLGRQQIAGIPTAINELFKNAHDAYADNVEIDYFRKRNLFILRDDGVGMTKEDFEQRWLTLGTESKLLNRKTPPPAKPAFKEKRPIMGEKGIGRLAIASIGSQVLILTKAERENESHLIVAAFINWKIFELPNLNLDDIVIPIREFDHIPTAWDIEEMKNEVIDSLQVLVESDGISEEEASLFTLQINKFKIEPNEFPQKIVGDFSFESKGGTHFYIYPVDDTLNSDIDASQTSNESTKMEKMLMGFTNTMTPQHPRPVIDIAFRDYKSDDGTYRNLLDEEQFFTPLDFEFADHHFEGVFDKYGQFEGVINIYNEKKFNHKINWSGNNYRETDCGPFKINFAYIQGRLKQSVIDPENHARILAKSDKFGGLYIYRDNIRILPYGNSDYDFIEIEKNRTKSASFYFFSFRRMFGVIDISRNDNFKLTEKAGREGFIENKAYRQLQDILKNFFVQLAADFFRESSQSSPKSEFWTQKRSEREAFYKALERRDKLAKVRKDKFIASLNHFFDDIAQKKHETDVNNLFLEIEKKAKLVEIYNDHDKASQFLLELEADSRKQIENYKQSIRISAPKGFSISKETRKDYDAYLVEFQKLESSVFLSVVGKIDEIIENYTKKLKIEISKRKRLEQSLEFISVEAKKVAFAKEKETRDTVSEITSKVKDLTNELMIDLDNQIRNVRDRFKELSINSAEDFDLVIERKVMESDISKSKDRVTNILDRIIRQLQGIYWDKDSDNEIITSDQISDAMAEELDELRERVHADIELSQLGLAVGVIHHEFNSTIRSIRGSLKDLKAWADVNANLDSVYKNIKINFEHLDGYLNLFTPLNRRLNRSREDIALLEIKTFLIDLFKTRLERHEIKFKHTKGFESKSINGFRSTFYPVFVNIIDNAIYWINQKNDEGEKVIRLHADESGIYISNNGPSILAQDSDRIFELGFTRKLNGRGMGLHISKEVLNAENYTLLLDSPKEGSNVTFKITKITKEVDG